MRVSQSTAYAVAAGAVFANAAFAQENATPSGSVMTHVIQVGDTEGGLKFYPEKVQAAQGDLVQFQFFPKAHSVAQSTFDNPCMPLEGAGSPGFWTGFMPVEATDRVMPLFSILVNDTNPIWFYCATGKHCQNGMVGVINEPATERTLDAYKESAKTVGITGVPTGGVSGGSGNSTSPGSGSGTPIGGNNSSATVSSSPTPTVDSQEPGTGAGSVVGMSLKTLALMLVATLGVSVLI